MDLKSHVVFLGWHGFFIEVKALKPDESPHSTIRLTGPLLSHSDEDRTLRRCPSPLGNPLNGFP